MIVLKKINHDTGEHFYEDYGYKAQDVSNTLAKIRSITQEKEVFLMVQDIFEKHGEWLNSDSFAHSLVNS